MVYSAALGPPKRKDPATCLNSVSSSATFVPSPCSSERLLHLHLQGNQKKKSCKRTASRIRMRIFVIEPRRLPETFGSLGPNQLTDLKQKVLTPARCQTFTGQRIFQDLLALCCSLVSETCPCHLLFSYQRIYLDSFSTACHPPRHSQRTRSPKSLRWRARWKREGERKEGIERIRAVGVQEESGKEGERV